MNGFYENELVVNWFEDGKWEKYELRQSSSNQLHCKTSDESRIDVSIEQENGSLPNDRQSLYKLKVKVAPNKDGDISGVQLIAAVDPSMACTWKPHLAPKENMVIGDKAFRSPCIVLENEDEMCALIPDIHEMKYNRPMPHIMDYVRSGNYVMYGLCHYEATGHVYYDLAPEAYRLNQPITFTCYIVQWKKEKKHTLRDYRVIEQFIWDTFTKPELEKENVLPERSDLEPYVRYTYDWAFKRWESVCWQEFTIDDEQVGGHVFIVTAKQKPGKGKEGIWRETKSIWNQAWFSSLRSAYGYALWGRYWQRNDLIDKAEKALRFALSAPQTNGLFPGYYGAGDGNRWDTGKWVMSSTRRPDEAHREYVHLLDASWTCYWLLKWYRDIEQNERILEYVHRYVQRLLSLQFEDGNFPSWVRPHDLDVSPYLTESPQTSMHVMLLCLFHELEPNPSYIQAAENAAAYVMKHIMPFGRWEDFETYWSCSRQWEGKQYGKVDERSGLYNQCNFGIYWTAEALKDLYRATGKSIYLDEGEKALAELSLYQQIWQPPFFQIPVMGGFGVMTSDDEWNDARQSLFALTYMDYYQLTGKQRYKERALLAMQASFYMMYCPENDAVRKMYEETHPQFDAYDYGFHMENFNHGDSGSTHRVGEFTIFDWGNGAAATSLAEWMVRPQLLKK